MFSGASKENKVLLLLDGHVTHTQNFEVLNKARETQSWKSANVIPLHKKGSTNDVNNYRPVSGFSCVGKIFEKVVHKHVVDYIRERNILSEHQSGFPKK